MIVIIDSISNGPPLMTTWSIHPVPTLTHTIFKPGLAVRGNTWHKVERNSKASLLDEQNHATSQPLLT